MPDQDDLPFGLYERLVTAGLKARLLRFDPASARVRTNEIDPAEAHSTLARHIEEIVARTLHDLPREDRAANQSQFVNRVISLLAGDPADPVVLDALVGAPVEQLLAIQPVTGVPNDDRDVVAPLGPLSASDLLVNARGEPNLAHALSHEIPSADSIDLLRAFVRWHGLRLPRQPRGVPSRDRAGAGGCVPFRLLVEAAA